MKISFGLVYTIVALAFMTLVVGLLLADRHGHDVAELTAAPQPAYELASGTLDFCDQRCTDTYYAEVRSCRAQDPTPQGCLSLASQHYLICLETCTNPLL